MAPSKDKCLICSEVFFGRQASLKCAVCEGRAHVVCLKLSDEELKIYKQSFFKCDRCLVSKQRHNDNTPIRGVGIKPVNMNNPNDGSAEDDGFDWNGKNSLTDLLNHFDVIVQRKVDDILVTLLKEFTDLKAQVKQLTEENVALRMEVRGSGSSSCLLSDAIGRASNFQSSNGLFTETGHSGTTVEAANSDLALLAVAGEDVPQTSAGVNESLWTKVVKRGKRSNIKDNYGQQVSESLNGRPKTVRRQRSLVIGSGASDEHIVRVRKKAFFLSRFAPNVVVGDLEGILDRAGVRGYKCTRLRTKFPSYNSFHVLVDAENAAAMLKSEIWPKGILISPFFGPLNNIYVSSSDSVEGEKSSVS